MGLTTNEIVDDVRDLLLDNYFEINKEAKINRLIERCEYLGDFMHTHDNYLAVQAGILYNKSKDLIAANKIILSLEEKVKELEAVNERLKGEL